MAWPHTVSLMKALCSKSTSYQLMIVYIQSTVSIDPMASGTTGLGAKNRMSTSNELWGERESPLLSVVQMREAVAPNYYPERSHIPYRQSQSQGWHTASFPCDEGKKFTAFRIAQTLNPHQSALPTYDSLPHSHPPPNLSPYLLPTLRWAHRGEQSS
jgi:hypothetical protein